MKTEILNTLRYFALFKHPLTHEELHIFLSTTTSPSRLEDALSLLISNNEIVKRGRFYQRSADPDYEQLREAKELKAHQMISKSTKYASIIASFPFVRSVAISGSISKLSAGKGADLDFFVVTSPNRLWIARTLLHLFKKTTFLTNHQRYFCMNYFVDEDHLELPFQNFYTALELSTLIPVYGKPMHESLVAANSWKKEHLPNHENQALAQADQAKPLTLLKTLAEVVFNVLAPTRLNIALMKLTDWKWRRKFAHLKLSDQEYERALMTRPYLSKNHPHDFQKRVLESMADPRPVDQIKSVYA